MKKKDEVTVRRRNDSLNSELQVEGGSSSSSTTSEQTANDSDDDSGISDQSNLEISTLVIIEHSGTHTKYADENPGLFRNFIQIFFPFLIAGAGMMLAGVLLDYVQVSIYNVHGIF